MARESRRKRDERRFGRPERLADLIVATPVDRWHMPTTYRGASGAQERWAYMAREIQSEVAGRAAVIDASNVATYLAELPGTRTPGDFAGCVAPFPVTFVEFGLDSLFGGTFSRIGWLCSCVERGPQYGEGGSIPDAKWFLDGYAVADLGGKPLFFGYRRSHGVREDFDISGTHYALCCLDPGRLTDWEAEFFREVLDPTFLPVLLAFAIANCKNAAMSTHEPDREVNRRRREAGLAPFLRHRTIAIEPVRRALSAEGNLEAEGLKRALHIVRGHIARYSEDRPLFGRAGMHGAFWVPAHTRGDSARGAIDKDYTIRPPKRSDGDLSAS